MFIAQKVPQYIFAILSQKGVVTADTYLATYCDMDNEHNFCDTYIVLTRDKLCVISGTESLIKNERGRKGPQKCFDEKSYIEHNLSLIDDIRVEELLSCSRLVAKMKNGESVFLSAMTNFCKTDAHAFTKYFSRIKKGDITSPDFQIDVSDDPKGNYCPKCGMRYPDRNRKICPHCMEKGKLYSRFAVFLKKYVKELVVMVLSLIMLTSTAILVPYFSNGFFFDNVLEPNGALYGQVLLAVGIVIATKALSHIADIITGYVTTKVSARIVYDLKNTIFGAIEKLSMRFFTGRQTGSLMTQVNSDSNTIYSFFCDAVPYFLINIIQVAVLIVVLFCMNPLLATLSLITVPLFVLALKFTFGTSKKLHARKFAGDRTMNSHLSDALSGIRVVKAFSKENEELGRFHIGNNRAALGNKRLAVFNNLTYPSIGLILYLGNIISWGVGGYMVMNGQFTYGSLITFTAYVNMIYSPIHFFVEMMDWSASCTNALQRLYEIYDTEPEITEKKDAITPEKIDGLVEFKNVDFSYDSSRKILKDVSLTVPAGQTLGIVGHTGAGKSTIANLIMRLYDSDEGGVYIDGINVKDLSFKSLYENIAIVSQETYLFIGTILDNIRYANPNATYEEVIRASKFAGAHEFIMKLPDAYNTKIGFGYKDLSGGERQRVSIARALLRDPKILILDEATAAMDTKTERLIQNALTYLTKGKTTIMIAHRLSTLRDADKLIVIEHGKVVETGTHVSLFEKEGGVYNKLYTLQTEALKNAGIIEFTDGRENNARETRPPRR